jgi:ssDNA-binding Zn-finger/Zn-ribbon topoisomerase 1
MTDEQFDALMQELVSIRQALTRMQSTQPSGDSRLGDKVRGWRCPKCGSDMKVLVSKNGKEYAGCTNYPECKGGIRWASGKVPDGEVDKFPIGESVPTQPAAPKAIQPARPAIPEDDVPF